MSARNSFRLLKINREHLTRKCILSTDDSQVGLKADLRAQIKRRMKLRANIPHTRYAEIGEESDTISSVRSLENERSAAICITPGFVDIQVDGLGGIDFSEPCLEPEDALGALPTLWQTGVCGIQIGRSLSNSRTRLAGGFGCFTLGPELVGALDVIRRPSDSGIVVALGHTEASAEQIEGAVNAGARLSTHIGNGSHARLSNIRIPSGRISLTTD